MEEGDRPHRPAGLNADHFHDGQLPAQLYDDWGKWPSYRSSNATQHMRDGSTDNSIATGTNPSSRSDDANSQQNVDVAHKLCILEPDSEDFRPGPSFQLTLSSVRHYSRVLFNHLRSDYRHGQYSSTISVSKPVPLPISASTLQLFIMHIDNPPPTPDLRAFQMLQWDPYKLFELSIVLWAYECSIDQWLPTADSMKSQIWPQDRRNLSPSHPATCIFLALLYDWPDVFEEASLDLVSMCSGFEEELDRTTFIPIGLREQLTLRRQEYVQDTLAFIREAWHLLIVPTEEPQTPLFAAIYQVFLHRWNIDLRQLEVPRDLHKSVSPNQLLRLVEDTVSEPHSQRDESRPRAGSNGPPTQLRRGNSRLEQQALNSLAQTNRESEAANALSNLVTAFNVWRRRKNAPHDTNQEADAQVFRERFDGDQLLERCRQFREQRLRPLSINYFSGLRRRQLILHSR